MKIAIEVKPDLGQFRDRLQGDISGARKAGMLNLLTTVEAKAVKGAPHKTGNLARSRTSTVDAKGDKGILTFTAPYAEPVHEGTGIYGPRKRRIVPKTKKALFWPGAKHPVKSVAGMKGRPFITDAVAETNVQGEYDAGMGNYMRQRGWI